MSLHFTVNYLPMVPLNIPIYTRRDVQDLHIHVHC